MNHPVDVLDQVVRDLDGVLCAETVAGLSDAEKLDVLRAAGEVVRRAEALIVETVASVPARPAGSGDPAFCGQFGCRSMSELLQRVLRTDAAGAGRVIKAARLVRRDVDISSGGWLPALWPQLRAALVDGAVGITGLLAATGPIEQARGRVGAVDRLQADAELAAWARGTVVIEMDADADADPGIDVDEPEPGPAATPEDLRILAQRIVMFLDPDGAEPAEEATMRGRGMILGRVKNGLIPIHGDLLPETAGQLQRIWDAYLNPKVDGPPLPGVQFVPSDDGDARDGQDARDGRDARDARDRADRDGDVLPSGDPGGQVDTRSRAQKQHDAFTAMLGIAARHDEMPKLGGAAATLIVSVTAEEYATGHGWAHIDGIDTPTTIAAARHTACGGTIQRVLFDPEGRIVGIGSTDRIFTTHQRRAITLRDTECLIPGCHVPASWCEIHHVQEHARGGPTHTDNGVALCWHHHRTLDTSGWEIRMDNGLPTVRGPAWWDPHRRWRTPRPTTTHRRSGAERSRTAMR
ncbi:HNH endonuclease signature motif containing protein [Microbacterium sp. LWO12-1.2]|uniref:HNH endonuclease signature motif containing protein n=1 Tax=Microbacterium sp. LWO12-1.2 TaxID=3135261 RepID=UPI00344AFFDB